MKTPFPFLPENRPTPPATPIPHIPPGRPGRDGGGKGRNPNVRNMRNEKSNYPIQIESTPVTEIWLDKQDILIRMHISSRTLQRWRSKGMIPFCRIGKKLYYLESDLNKLYSQHLQNPSPTK
jgi:hypothetical protein